MRSIYAHVHFLFDTFFSTKECLEDVIGSLSSMAKKSNTNPFKAASPERLFFHHVLSVRWNTAEFPLMRLQPGDMTTKQFYSTSTARTSVFLPRHFKKHPSLVVERLSAEVHAESDSFSLIFS